MTLARIFRRRPSSWLETSVGSHVLVHMTNDMTIAGTLTFVGKDCILLRAAKYLDSKSVDLGGEVAIQREQISFVQKTALPLTAPIAAGVDVSVSRDQEASLEGFV